MPRPPAPRGSRRAAPSRRRAVLPQLRPPLNPTARAPRAASPPGSWRCPASERPATPPPGAPPRPPLGEAPGAPPRRRRWGRAAAPSRGVEAGKLCAMAARGGAGFGVVCPTSRKLPVPLISPPPPPGVPGSRGPRVAVGIARPRGPQTLGRPAAVSPRADLPQLAPPGGLKVSNVEPGGNNWVEFIQMKTSC